MPEQTTPTSLDLPVMPSAGGSYTRQPDGSLVRDDLPPAITTASVDAAPAAAPGTEQPQE